MKKVRAKFSRTTKEVSTSKRAQIQEPLTQEEIEKLSSIIKNWEDQFIFFVLLDTGLRLAEFLSLRKDNIDYKRKILIIRGKGNKLRHIPLTDRAFNLLQQYFHKFNKLHWGARTIQKRITQLKQKAKIQKRVTPHTLRHTFAVQMLRKTNNLRALQQILGHTDIRTTSIYLSFYDSESAAESIRKILEATEGGGNFSCQFLHNKTNKRNPPPSVFNKKLEET